MSDIARLAIESITRTALRNTCVRKGCNRYGLPLVHTLSACNPAGTIPCNEKSCMDPQSHGVDNCNPVYRVCLKQDHLGAGEHLVHDCNQYSDEGNIGYAAGQFHPKLRLVNPAMTFEDLERETGLTVLPAPSTEIALYTGPMLERYTRCTDDKCVIKYEHSQNQHVMCQNPECPYGGDHRTDRDCPPWERYIPKNDRFTVKDETDIMPESAPNKVTLMMRAKRFVRNTWHNRHAISAYIVNELIYLVAMLPLIAGVLNSLVAIGSVHTLLSALTDAYDLASMTLLFVSTCMLASAFLIVLPAWSRYFTFPGGTRFDQHHRALTFGSGLLVTSVIVEIIAGCIFLQR